MTLNDLIRFVKKSRLDEINLTFTEERGDVISATILAIKELGYFVSGILPKDGTIKVRLKSDL